VFALCRALVTAGHDPNRPLHAYRGDVLCLRVRSIGEGARLTIEDDRHGRPRLRRWRNRPKGCGAAAHGKRRVRLENWLGGLLPPPVRQIGDTAHLRTIVYGCER
jgi:hypothetical protein